MTERKILSAAALVVLAWIAQIPSALADLDPLTASADMLSLRDPFRRPNVDAQNERPKSDLETFPADQLKMIGVVTGPKKLKAMILAPNGKTYFVTLNTRVGLRNGVITKITDETVLIREKVVNLLGQQEDLETPLQLIAEHRNLLVDEASPRSGPGSRAQADVARTSYDQKAAGPQGSNGAEFGPGALPRANGGAIEMNGKPMVPSH